MKHRTLAPSQTSEIWLGGPDLVRPELLFVTDEMLIEAPNWSLDGESLLLNGHGDLWRLDVAAPDRGLTHVAFEALPEINNDHVLAPDAQHIYMSAMDGHIYRGALSGGPVERVSPNDGYWHYLHGVAPDGRRLAYVQLDERDHIGRLAVLPLDGSPEIIDVGDGHLDGPEWSPDGAWLYLNTEAFTSAPGHAQLARMPDQGGEVERLVASDTVDWFPHLSPDSHWAAYIAFPPGTTGHPPDLPVEVRVVDTSDWATTLQGYPLFGGQGTINVNSWSPDSSRFAFVAYPLA